MTIEKTKRTISVGTSANLTEMELIKKLILAKFPGTTVSLQYEVIHIIYGPNYPDTDRKIYLMYIEGALHMIRLIRKELGQS